MAWFKVDHHFMDHPAVLEAGDEAMGLWLRLGCWLARFPEQGDRLPRSLVDRYGTKRQVRRLLAADLLTRTADGHYRLNPMLAIAGSGLAGRSWGIDPGSSRRGIPAWLRAAVYDRDGRACVECGATEDLTLDHIYPHSLGGDDSLDNLRTLCRPCNSAKGNRV